MINLVLQDVPDRVWLHETFSVPSIIYRCLRTTRGKVPVRFSPVILYHKFTKLLCMIIYDRKGLLVSDVRYKSEKIP
jgi:hypothetical protein